jgi:putative hydrolase of HD superfamily
MIMHRVNYRQLTNFFDYVIELKQTKRSGWLNKVRVKNPESVADHTYSMSTIIMVFSDILALRTEKAMKMAILHDLGESIIGDYAPDEISRIEKVSKETEAIYHITNHLPHDIRKEYQNLWKEYLENKTEIAQLVHGVDKLEMAIQAKKYQSQGYSSSILRQFIKSSDGEIHNKKMLRLLRRTKNAVFATREQGSSDQ